MKHSRLRIERPGKGAKLVRAAITNAIREILWPLRGQHPSLVFSFVAERTIDKVIHGKPYRFCGMTSAVAPT